MYCGFKYLDSSVSRSAPALPWCGDTSNIKIRRWDDCDWTGGPIKYSARNRTDPARPLPAAAGGTDHQQLHVSRHLGHCAAGRTGQQEGVYVDVGQSAFQPDRFSARLSVVSYSPDASSASGAECTTNTGTWRRLASVKAKPRVLEDGCCPSTATAIGRRSSARAAQPRGTATTGYREC
jgi:hypothetical protein